MKPTIGRDDAHNKTPQQNDQQSYSERELNLSLREKARETNDK